MTDATALPEEQIDPAAEEGSCEHCGRHGLLSRITSRVLTGRVTICDECLDAYRRGGLELTRFVIQRFRPR